MERMMDIMRGRDRRRLRITSRTRERHLERRRDENRIQRMGFVDLNPLGLTIYCLLNSFRISIDSRSRVFLIYARYGVKEAVALLKSLDDFSDLVESKKMKGLVAEINEAALKLEDVLDSLVSDQFLSQSETFESVQLAGEERGPLLYSLNMQGIEQDIDGFIQKMMEMEKLLNPWSEEGVSESSHQSQVRVNRTVFISLFATKAASVFLGMKEDYIKELENLLPENVDDGVYGGLFTSDFYRSRSMDDFGKTKNELIIWWINKAASIFVEEEEKEQQPDKPLPEEDVVSSTGGHALNVSNMVGSTDLFCQIRNDLIEGQGGFCINSIVGMAGIGKTALAQKILQDPLISTKFECCIFVRLGTKYQPKEIMQAILAQIPDGDKLQMAEHGDLSKYLIEILKVKKCLIVLDDAWDRDLWENLLCKIYPEDDTESSILITTRKNQVAYSDGDIIKCHS